MPEPYQLKHTTLQQLLEVVPLAEYAPGVGRLEFDKTTQTWSRKPCLAFYSKVDWGGYANDMFHKDKYIGEFYHKNALIEHFWGTNGNANKVGSSLGFKEVHHYSWPRETYVSRPVC